MYVQCERCKTEYDFDDALVSERGTTVKCTSCGFQFKVRRSSEGAQDKWTVTTKNGTKQVFTTLRELQKAIIAKQIARQDLLARGEGPPRPLGTIAELEPFFDETKRPSSRPPVAGSARPPPVAPTRKPLPSVSGPPRPKTDTLRPPDLGAAVPPPTVPQIQEASQPLARTIGALEASYAGPNPALVRRAQPQQAPPQPVPQTPIPPPRAGVDAQQQQRLQVQMATAATPMQVQPPPPSATEPQVHMPAPMITTAQPMAPEMSSPLPPPARPEQISMIDEGPPVGGLMDRGPKRRWGGWVFAVLLIGAVSAGVYFGRPYLMGGTKPASSAPLDPQAEAYVTDGERALQEGRLDDAKTFFDKASALAPKDAHVLLDVARLETIRADLAWLDLRLADNPNDDAKKRQLEDLGGKSLHAADAALMAAPEDLSANRTKVDALRIVGNLSDARNLAPKLKAIDGQPETAYVLAALDLAEPGPQYKLVIDRLRSASMGEGALGRAQALLIFALVKSGDTPGAKHEVDRLGSLLRPHPLIGALRAFVDRAPGPVAATDAGAEGGAPSVDVNALPPGGGGGGGGGGGDSRALIAQAEAAKNRGDYAKAKDLYGKALAKSPNDSEALAGLGDVSHAQRDYANAQTYYKQALAANGSFIPALIGLGDVQWEQGDKTAAKATYKEIVDRFPEAAYPARVKQRLEGSAPAPDEPR